MNFLTIPLSANKPWQTFNIALSGVTFNLTFYFNTRMGIWIMDINDVNGNPIISGLSVLIERDLLSQFRHLAVPAGTIFAYDNTGEGNQPGLYSFGNTHTLFYEDPTS